MASCLAALSKISPPCSVQNRQRSNHQETSALTRPQTWHTLTWTLAQSEAHQNPFDQSKKKTPPWVRFLQSAPLFLSALQAPYLDELLLHGLELVLQHGLLLQDAVAVGRLLLEPLAQRLPLLHRLGLRAHQLVDVL